MAFAAQALNISEQDYLVGELHSEIRHELIDGHVYAMAGAHKNHGRISRNLIRQLEPHLDHTSCESFAADMKVKVEHNFFYPDVVVVCQETGDNDYFTESPILIVEVLSHSTRKHDKTIKRLAYQSLLSLQEYVLMEQDVVEIEVCRRANNWQAEYYFLGDEVHFASVDVHLVVESLYARVENAQMREWQEGKQNV